MICIKWILLYIFVLVFTLLVVIQHGYMYSSVELLLQLDPAVYGGHRPSASTCTRVGNRVIA